MNIRLLVTACGTMIALSVAPPNSTARGIPQDSVPVAATEESSAEESINTFFALCHDTHDTKKRTVREQAELLNQLGYDGVGHLWLDGISDRLQTLDEFGLELVQVYIRASVDPQKPKYDPRLKDVVRQLRGRDTIFGLLIGGMPPSSTDGDPRAVEIVRQIADMADASGLRVGLYPHTGDWLERVDDAIRIARKVDRKNVGVMFNLCHWLKAENGKNMRPVLKAALPHLMVVTINGEDNEGDWSRLIQPLDRGSFDIHGFLKTLDDLGYRGPIGLQCYGISGDVRDALTRSMKAWQELSARIAAEKN